MKITSLFVATAAMFTLSCSPAKENTPQVEFIKPGEQKVPIPTFALESTEASDTGCGGHDCIDDYHPTVCQAFYGGSSLAIVKIGRANTDTVQLNGACISDTETHLRRLFDVVYTQKIEVLAVAGGNALPETFLATTQCAQTYVEHTDTLSSGTMIVTVNEHKGQYFVHSCTEIDLSPDGEYEFGEIPEGSENSLGGPLPNTFEELVDLWPRVLSDYESYCDRVNLIDEPEYDLDDITERVLHCDRVWEPQTGNTPHDDHESEGNNDRP